MQVRKEKEAELFANDQYWANRLKNQEAEFLKNSKIMEQEFNDTVSCTRNCLPVKSEKINPELIFRWATSRNDLRNHLWPASCHLVKTSRIRSSNATGKIQQKRWSARLRCETSSNVSTLLEQARLMQSKSQLHLLSSIPVVLWLCLEFNSNILFLPLWMSPHTIGMFCWWSTLHEKRGELRFCK